MRNQAKLRFFVFFILLLNALDVEFGFSRVDFPPKGSKTQRIVVILAKTLFLLDALDVEFDLWDVI